MQKLQAAGYRIPEDLAVTGFDDMDFARVLEPPLTTVTCALAGAGDTRATDALTTSTPSTATTSTAGSAPVRGRLTSFVKRQSRR